MGEVDWRYPNICRRMTQFHRFIEAIALKAYFDMKNQSAPEYEFLPNVRDIFRVMLPSPVKELLGCEYQNFQTYSGKIDNFPEYLRSYNSDLYVWMGQLYGRSTK